MVENKIVDNETRAATANNVAGNRERFAGCRGPTNFTPATLDNIAEVGKTCSRYRWYLDRVIGVFQRRSAFEENSPANAALNVLKRGG
jgi:hypothetical protein